VLSVYSKFRIRRAIDRGATLPDWLQRRLANDPSLRDYAKTYAAMIRSLSAKSDVWMSEKLGSQPALFDPCELIRSSGRDRLPPNPAFQFLDIGKVPARKAATDRVGLFPQWSLALATLLLLVCGWIATQQFMQQPRQRQSADYQTQVTIAATKAVWNGSRRVARRSWELCEQTVDSISQACLDRVAATAIEPVEDSGRWLGLAIGQLQQAAEQEKSKIATSLKRLSTKLERQPRPKK
jgi:hypothetical protein